MFRVSRWIQLQLALSGLALLVVLVRSGQLAHAAGTPGVHVVWGPILATQAAFWITWSVWAGAVVAMVRRLVERTPSRVSGVAALVILALLPPWILPAVYAPVHRATFNGPTTFRGAYSHLATHDGVTNVFLSATIVAVVYGYLSLQHARRMEVRASQLAEELTRAQLTTLRAQLNPHFLFNALNSITVLARRAGAGEVVRTVTELAELLRYSLESASAQLVSLQTELDVLRHYLAIEQVRHGDRLAASIDVPPDCLSCTVPSFLMQPLVENAIRHGFRDAVTVLHVTVRCQVRGDRLLVEICDDGVGMQPGDASGDGVGLGATRSRLDKLYGADASLTITPTPVTGGTCVRVSLPDSRKQRMAGAPA